jgi:hypothetical protein
VKGRGVKGRGVKGRGVKGRGESIAAALPIGEGIVERGHLPLCLRECLTRVPTRLARVSQRAHLDRVEIVSCGELRERRAMAEELDAAARVRAVGDCILERKDQRLPKLDG